MSKDPFSAILPDPTALTTEDVLDSLLYQVLYEPTRNRAVLVIEIDTGFHGSLIQKVGAAVTDEQALMLELIAEGVSRLEVEGVNVRPLSWAPDEKPHNCEVTSLVVRRRRLSTGFAMELRLGSGPRLTLEFSTLRVATSSLPPGVTHDYEP